MRVRGAASTSVLAVVVACALVSAAAAAATRPVATVITRTQASALKHKAVQIRVRSPHTARVRVFATIGPRGGIVATAPRDIRVSAHHPRVIRLGVARGGMRPLLSCNGVRVVAYAARAGTPESGPGPVTRRTRRLRRDRAHCRKPKATAYSTPSDAARCDFLDRAVCLQPWPNDYFTTRDPSTATKKRLNLQLLSMPRNRAQKPIDPTDIDRNDGFSPGSTLITRIPGLDTRAAFKRSRIVPLTNMGQAFARRQPVVVIDVGTKARHLIWAELDANAHNRGDVNLIIRPGRNFREGHRYVVALRNLVDARGKAIPATRDFRLYRDRIVTTNKAVESRRVHFESIFRTLAAAGVARDSVYRAWDFSIASARNLSERVLAMRNDAFKRLGDTHLADLKAQGSSPQFSITRVQNNPDPRLARIVDGTITVPCYLDKPGCPSGSRFMYSNTTTGRPVLQPIPGNTYTARFRCIVPKAAANGGARPSLYGHGLFGSRGEVEQDQLKDMAQEHNFVFCGTEWIGMACADVPDPTDPAGVFADVIAGNPPMLPECDIPNVATILTDLSNFSTLTDRVQQGMVDFTYLGRAMLKGFNSNPAFKLNGHGVIDTRRLFYDGNSQGGIIGGALIAIEPDLNRGVIGVPGMNYSTLLTRSHDFGNGKPPSASNPIPEYAYPLYQSYPNERERPLVFALIQTLWDRAEADGYAQHMTNDPLPDTPRHRVLMQGGVGDWQVAQVAAETEARTIGASTHRPYTDPGRDFSRHPGYGLPTIKRYPFAGSAYMIFDSGPPRKEGDGYTGTTPPPPSNTIPPITPPPVDQQEDPHELPRRTKHGRRQKSAFLTIGGVVINVCGSKPCYSGTWKGP